MINNDPMRTRDEIQRAHDILSGVILYTDLSEHVDEEMLRAITMRLDALCWILRHDHNDRFQELLELVEAHLAALGIEIVRYPEMQYPGKGGKHQ